MRMLLGLWRAGPGLLLCAVAQFPATPARDKYLDYSVYAALRALVPGIPGARLRAGLAEAGYELWAKGQLRMPTEGWFVRADITQEGSEAVALLLEGQHAQKPAVYLLIARQGPGGWSRLLLQEVGESSQGIGWDERRKAIAIGPGEAHRMASSATMSWGPGSHSSAYGYTFDVAIPAYVHWNLRSRRFEYAAGSPAPFRPWMLRANLESYAELSAPDFEGVHIKISPVGSNPELPAGFVMLAPGYALNPEFFQLYRRPSIVDRGDLRSIVLTPTEVQAVVDLLRRLKNLDAVLERTTADRSVAYAVSVLRIDPDPLFCELLLTPPEARSFLAGVSELTGGPLSEFSGAGAAVGPRRE